MDEFLVPFANFKRLYEEYKKYGNSLAIGVDFDNTVYDYHEKGYTYSLVLATLRKAVHLGMKIHVFTANPDHEKVQLYMDTQGVKIEGINTDGVKFDWESRKPFYNLLLDDRAGLISAVEDLTHLIEVIESEQ